ncbi:hypothetical protein F2Q70_00002184 [Brassica cretica]|uniref:Uncharacterized protein n=1 Tax=Brassica cretica TaxID=69181 RepID=A0A8S9IRX4_BRACR|nr:hypothetical protein F2Q70_00002184 [Brassica cretica]
MPTESTASCNALKILTHEEFAAKHPHSPSPVNMPEIDVARLNALRPKPKPSEYPPEPVRTPSDDGEDPVEEDMVPSGRILRRRKEKVNETNRSTLVQMSGRTTTTTPILPLTPDIICMQTSMMKTMRRNELLSTEPSLMRKINSYIIPLGKGMHHRST